MQCLKPKITMEFILKLSYSLYFIIVMLWLAKVLAAQAPGRLYNYGILCLSIALISFSYLYHNSLSGKFLFLIRFDAVIPIFYFVTGLLSRNTNDILPSRDDEQSLVSKVKEAYDFLRTKLLPAMIVVFQIIVIWLDAIITPK